MIERDRIYVGGTWTEPRDPQGSMEVFDSNTEEAFARIRLAGPGDVDAAVAAASEAFRSWSATDPAERGKWLKTIGEALAARSAEIAETVSREVGMPLNLSSMIQAGLPVANFQAYADLAEKFSFEERVGNSLVVYEPVGVVGAITPWNYPLHQIVAKVAPALAAGCTVVLKPSEVAPLSAYILAEVIDEVGLPAGVFNLVPGTGPVVGEAMATHPGVDMVSFTGSTRAGKRVYALASETVKRVALELGGKSANIILDDADLERCIPPSVQFGCYLNSGQTCSALTRMLVPRHMQDEVARLAAETAERLRVGPSLENPDLGPLASAAQLERVRGYIRKGIEEGATLVCGGPEPPEGLEKGYFVRPTVFADVRPDMTIAQEEIFGPVLSIIPYETEEEAVEIANGTIYGLSGAVQSSDQERALRVARRLRTGQVEVNGGSFNLHAPFGGFKQSGIGRELGRWGLEEYLETKAIQLPG